MAAALELFPIFAGARTCCAPGPASSTSARTPRRSSGPTPVEDLYVNCGWGTGGFKATPAPAGSTRTRSPTARRTPLNAPFALDRFTTGALIDEHGAAAVAH